MSPNLQFPFKLAAPRRRLLAPLRAEIERHEAAGRAALAKLTAIDGCDLGPFQDCVECLLAGETELSALALARDAERVTHLAIRRDRRQGYDTWKARDLDRLITALTTLATTLRALHSARRDLAHHEAEEIAALKQATA